MDYVNKVINDGKDELVTRTTRVEFLQGFIYGLSEVIGFVENDE